MRKQNSQIDWDDLRFFLAVMRSGQISHAARQLSVDHATVARRIDHLERTLDTMLFERGRGGYRPTAAADTLLRSAERAEAAILVAESDISGGNSAINGRVRIGAPDGFGNMFLAPRIGALRELYPALEVELVTMVRPFSLSSREVDVAIGLELPARGRLFGRKLADFSMGLYASAEYLRTRKPILTVEDLRDHDFIGYVEEFSVSRDVDFLALVSPHIAARVRTTSWLGRVQAAATHVGIVLLPPFLIPDHLRLVPVLPQEVRIEKTFYILMHEDSRDISRIRAVARFITDAVNEDIAAFQPPTRSVTPLRKSGRG